MQTPETTPTFFWPSAISASTLSLLPGFLGTFIVPAFAQVHSIASPGELGLLTHFIDGHSQLLWIAILPCLATWVIWSGSDKRHQTKLRTSRAFAVQTVLQLGLLMTIVYAMYAPMLQMT